MKILVAEDDRATRTRILAFLKEWGHEGIAARDGEEAWELFQSEEVGMVITDWQMPGMDGPELLRRIRETEGELYVYALLLTSRSEKSDVVEGMESGADDFVSKPFDKDELRVRIQAAQRIIELEAALGEQNERLASANQILSAANRRMKASLYAAAKIQQSFLPETTPQSAQARFAWVYEPCDELGGDTLNVVSLDEDHVGIYIMDVSGHGVPAALLSVHLSRAMTRLHGPRSLVRKHVEQNGGGYELTPPSEVVSALNRNFSYDEESSQYFTAVYGVLDLKAGEFCYTSAGHPGPLIVSKGVGEQRKARPPAVGFLPVGNFQEERVVCAPGDRMYFYTDGIFEVSNAEGEQFGVERLREVLEGATDMSLEESLASLRDRARSWAKDGVFDDDVSLIGVEICGEQS